MSKGWNFSEVQKAERLIFPLWAEIKKEGSKAYEGADKIALETLIQAMKYFIVRKA